MPSSYSCCPAQPSPLLPGEPGWWQQHPAAAHTTKKSWGTAQGTPSTAPSHQYTAIPLLRVTHSSTGSQESPAWKGWGEGEEIY